MGGDRTCPDDCLLAVWANLSEGDRKAQRKAIATTLYQQGFTQEQIATQLGVSQYTISKDLDGLLVANKPKRPKGGRPKGSKRKGERGKAAKFAKAREIVRPRVEADEALKAAELEQQHGISRDTFERAALAEQARKEALADPEIDRSALSMTAQQKFDAALRQYKKKLDAEYDQRVHEGVRQRLDEFILPHWKKQIEEAKRIYDRRKGIMDKTTFNMIRRGLHPDSRNAISDQKLGEAFNAFMRLEKFLLDEKDSPTDLGVGLPRTWAEMEARRAAVQAERRAKRAANRASSTMARR